MAPVVSASVGVLGPLLVKLTGLLAGEYGRLKRVRREIISLRCELSSMHAAVEKYMVLEEPDVQVKEWISMVRELAYDTEDCIDKFIHRLSNANSRNHRGFKEFLHETAHHLKTLGARRGIANQIDDLKARIRQVKELKNSYKLDGATCTTSTCINSGHTAVDPRLCAFFAEEAHLVGIDNPRDDLTNWMMKDGDRITKHRLRVLSIVGFGGLGKTTLANEIYRKIQGHFDCRAFVSVSQRPNYKRIIKDVISQVLCQDGSSMDTDDWDEQRSIVKLRELLQDKRYLIIIDDVWSTQAWNTIKCAFPENNCSSRIIATTRIVDVARSCCLGGQDRVIEMKALSDLHSRRLFFKRIFGSEECYPDMLKEVSKKILKKCGGLPLAIISISSLLANRPVVKEEWEKIKRSIGAALEKTRTLEGISIILSLSYNDLPPNLKTCFLYLSVFPEDYFIDRKRLVRLWIAEGFISEERGQSRQEVAESYFYELINKSMVQPVDIGYDGRVRACRVHDMMLEILISKSTECNFVTTVDGGQTSLPNRQCVIRRLSVQHIDQKLASRLASEDLSHVRSLIVTSSGRIRHLPSLGKFEALGVLDFEDREGLEEYIMNGMEKLFRLKYLRLSNPGISKLPSGIVMLGDLETLDLRNTSLRELPAGIVRLTKLQHLITSMGTIIPIGIGDMRNLEVISGFRIAFSPAHAVEDLGNLTSLAELQICLSSKGFFGHYFRNEQMLLSALCKLSISKLQSLVIDWDVGIIRDSMSLHRSQERSLEFLDSWSPLPVSLRIFRMISHYYLTNVPKWIAPALTSLACLEINLTELTQEGLCTLRELPALLDLELSLETGSKSRLTIQGIGFPSLKRFVLKNRFRAEYITFVKGAMPKLEILDLSYNVSVAKRYGFYFGIQHLPCLKQADIHLHKMGATHSQSKAAVAAIKNELRKCPSQPLHNLY